MMMIITVNRGEFSKRIMTIIIIMRWDGMCVFQASCIIAEKGSKHLFEFSKKLRLYTLAGCSFATSAPAPAAVMS